MKRPDIIFFDIDGTLLDMKTKVITPALRQLLRDLSSQGVRLGLCTGRSPIQVPKIEDVHFDVLLCYNGSLCFSDQGELIRSAPLKDQDVQKIIDNATAIGRPVAIATDSEILANGADQDLIDYYWISKQKLIPEPDFEKKRQGKTVYQIMSSGRKEEYPALMKDVDGAEIAAWWDRAVDIIPAGGGKGKGVEAVLTYYGLTADQAAAFGDGDNDLPMIEAVGCGVAMGNGSPALKEAAAFICKPVDQDGIVSFVYERGWLNPERRAAD